MTKQVHSQLQRVMPLRTSDLIQKALGDETVVRPRHASPRPNPQGNSPFA